jgi:hypothetical protein
VWVADQNAVENYQSFQVNLFARKPTSIACSKELLTIHVQRRRYNTWVDHLIGQGEPTSTLVVWYLHLLL